MEKVKGGAVQAAVPATGTYAKRAEALRAALDGGIVGEFGRVEFSRRGTDEMPYLVWNLPEDVRISVSRYRDADPRVMVSREDPVNRPPCQKDWENETFERDCKTKDYGVAAIVANAKEFIEYNRLKRLEHEANRKAYEAEMAAAGVIPEGMELVRDPKTGRYRFWMYMDVDGLTAEEAHAALDMARNFRTAYSKARGGGPA